jgi:hypothetical protein
MDYETDIAINPHDALDLLSKAQPPSETKIVALISS